MHKLIWLDLEMTGLAVETNRIIEAAAIITDFDWNVLETYHSVVQQPQEFLDKMDDWNKQHHGASGLLAKIPEGRAQELVEQDLVELIKRHFNKNDRVILAGNSIAQDRLFIDCYMKNFASLLHYRMVDVSSWKIIFNEKFDMKFQKKNSHRALDDIQESIDELKFYLQHVKVEKKSQ